jgi:predicted nucleic acid-binding protein
MSASSAYIDTSVLGAYYCQESLSTTAQQLLQDCVSPAVSTLAEVEFIALVTRKRREKELSEATARDVLGIFARHLDEGFYRRIALATDHASHARELLDKRNLRLRTLDALHLAMASLEGLPLMTSDLQLAREADKAGFQVIRVVLDV